MAKVKDVDIDIELCNLPKYNVPIVAALRGDEKSGDMFECNASVVSYKTGIPTLDYYLGYMVRVFDANGELVDEYPSLGITGGSFVTFIGKPSTSKSATAVTVAANIVREFSNGFVIHFDLEQAMTYSRIQNLTKFSMPQMKSGKYILRQEISTIENIKEAIMRIYFEKTRNPNKYKYKTGKMNEFGEEIEVFEPTVVIVDSIAALNTGYNENEKKDVARLFEVGSQTERMRITGEITRFFNELLPYIRRANIIVLTINQIKVKASVGAMPSPAEIMYLAQDESLPGGRAPQFNAHVLIKFIGIGSQKFNEEDDGFGGFGVEARIIKSRGNQAGRSVNLIYDKVRGIDSLRSTLLFAKENGFLGGNKNATYFVDAKDKKFSMTNVHDEFRNDRSLYTLMFDTLRPVLISKLSTVSMDDLTIVPEEMNY